jgi:hypothetical protein
MAAHVTCITCEPGVWTLLAENVSSVAFEWRSETAVGKWVIGQGDPPETTTQDYKTIRPKSPQSLNDLSVSDKIWAMPEGSIAQKMEVIAP